MQEESSLQIGHLFFSFIVEVSYILFVCESCLFYQFLEKANSKILPFVNRYR